MYLGQFCLFLVALATGTNAQGGFPTQLQTVSNGADVLFVLDGSDRVTAQQWVYMQQWLQRLTEYWRLGYQGVQVGFYTYGGGSHPQWMLKQAGNYQQVQSEIQGLSLTGGTATAGQAIRQAYREGFSTENGGRAGVPKIIVHVSSGSPSDPAFYYQEVQDAMQSGVSVYHVGVGAGASALPGDLSQVASEPSYRYVMSAQNYQTLNTLTSPLAARIADELPSGPGAALPPASGSSCLQQADVVFMLDGSSSVGDANFQRLVNYVKTFSSQLPVSQNGVHVGVMQFSSRPNVEFGLGVYTDRGSLLKGIDNIRYMGGGTNTADAINTMRTQMFSQGMGARPGVPRVAIVVTDGRSTSVADTVNEADLARQNQISLLAVGVGNGVNQAELQGIADRAQDVFTVNSFEDLSTITQSLEQRACQAQGTVSPLSNSLPAGVVDPCSDAIDNCNAYESSVCQNFASWANDNCARTCGFCQAMTPDVLPPCTDKLPNCGDYDLSMCSDQQYIAWATDNCALYCGLCGTGTSTNGYYGQCFYEGQSYVTGQSWDDGCDYHCTCEDGATGKYRCFNQCPLYSELPAQCTLVQTPGECCLKPVCNWNPTIQTEVTSGLGVTPDGMRVCQRGGNQYMQGQSWDEGCDLKCVCEDANTGQIRCQSYCPIYTGLPNNCHLEQKPGSCCSEPVCEFTTQSGYISGTGQTSGNGAINQPTNPPPCVDNLRNCDQYTDEACQAPYLEWAMDNCRAFCGLCTGASPTPSDNDRCTYQGQLYRQGESWQNGCTEECVCENAVYGYYRCNSLCPSYTNIPAECTRTPAGPNQCCETITCPDTTRIVPSSTNVLTIGSGDNIFQPNPQSPNQMVPVVPSLSPSGATVAPGTPYQGYQAPAIQGCLYDGQLYVQGQRWDDGCSRVCECTSASQGLYTCSDRCPSYQNLPTGCNLVPDTADPCCQTAVCQPNVNFVPVPDFGRGTETSGVARPPNPNELMATSTVIVVTQFFPQSANSAPTMPSGPVPTGGIGFCTYKNQTYQQSERWTDACDYNCLCQDASRGYWACTDRCLTYPPMPQYCRLVPDTDFPCCQKPYCEIPGFLNGTYGIGAITTGLPIITTAPPMVVTTTTPPRPAACIYSGQTYAQSQEWFDGCTSRCNCYDAMNNLYTCSPRCPTYFGIDRERCTEQPDPRDPDCCTVPICEAPSTESPDIVPTLPNGGFENTNPPGIVGFCEYKNVQYNQGETWTDECDYECKCEDATTGHYRCSERCPSFPPLPPECRLVTDFANPCCKKPVCEIPGIGSGISGQGTPPPVVTPSPGTQTAYCVYNGVQYTQGQTWNDGCSRRCRCEDALNDRYACNDRCATYADLPAECILVTDPNDLCCQIPQCSFTPNTGSNTGSGNPTPFPTYTPGRVTGEVEVPTPGPGLTPPPIGYCVYKGVQYSQGQPWDDGCDYTCRCEDQRTGRYTCDEKCPKYPNLPPQCRLLKDPANPCCTYPDCSFTPTSGGIFGYGSTPTPGNPITPIVIGPTLTPNPNPNTLTPNPNPNTLTPNPNPITPNPNPNTISPNPNPNPNTVVPPVATPSPTPVCVYRGQMYAAGQTWYDECDFVCVCETGSNFDGTYRCSDRCPSYPIPDGQMCTMSPDPNDPMCCQIPTCGTPQPTRVAPDGPFIVPTIAPVGQVTGGSVTVAPTPGVTVAPPTGPDGRTLIPPLAPGETTLVPPTGPDGNTLIPPLVTPQPREVCVYKSQQYTQGQTWQDGCDYNCECEDAPNGRYRCTEICPRYPPTPDDCYMVRDPNNLCCQIPVCNSEPDLYTTTTIQPPIIDTQVPPTGPDGSTLQPPVISTPGQQQLCEYNNVRYRTGETWEDGCDLRCRCEDQNLNVYRCDQRCPRYDLQPGCTMVTDPRDSCCLAPFCEPVLPPTQAPNLNPGQPATPSPNQAPVPTAVPGIIVGNSVNNPNINNPNQENMCVYNNVQYRQSQTWLVGCDRTCICVDQSTGRYECTERCPQYLNIPAYCTMVPNPADMCCEKPVCTNPVTAAPSFGTTVSPPVGVTQVPGVTTRAPQPGVTDVPNPNPNPNPNPTPNPNPSNPQPEPQPRNVCTYKNAVYVQGQQWYDGCDQVCVCEDGTTGYYRCSDRCRVYDSVPAGCTMVIDPNDPQCCRVPQCAPTPGPYGYPTPPPGSTLAPYVVTNVPGMVTGRAPEPTPGPDGVTPTPTNVCVYKGQMYARGQRWQDGCQFNCVCENEVTGEYRCTDRCSSYPMVPSQCRLTRDPSDFCCQIMTCDPSEPTPNPFIIPTTPSPTGTLAPNLQPSTPAPTPGPGETQSPRPIPVGSTQSPPLGPTDAPNPFVTNVPNPNTPVPTYVPQTFCVYNGVPYAQGRTWSEGCSRTCRCDDADRNYYTCQDRCAKYDNQDPTCTMALDPNDPCCLVPVCPVIPTPSPNLQPGQTPGPNGPNPTPSTTPYAVPNRIPTGSITGNNPNPYNPNTNPTGIQGLCVYKTNTFRQGQTWDDGCDYSCTCVDENTGRYVCNEKCDKYPDMPPYCVLVQDANDQCCQTPLCTPPVTQTPPEQVTQSPNPGVTVVPPFGQSTVTPAPGQPNTPVPGQPSTVAPPYNPYTTVQPRLLVCVMSGRTYTEGQQWYDDCDQICVCDDGVTGHYTCRQRCPQYPNADPTCLMVPDPSDPQCCTMPQCTNPQNPDIPVPVRGTITGPNPTVAPTPGVTVAPPTGPDGRTLIPPLAPGETTLVPPTGPDGNTLIPPLVTPQPRNVCEYKNMQYTTGQRWRDGCQYECVCEDGVTGRYTCTERCDKYPPIVSSTCTMVRDPNDACCQIPDCTTSPTAAPQLPPGQTPAPGGPTQSPNPNPNQVPNTALCVYQGVPYRQGQTWNDGCDKVCRCEDGMAGTVNCDDRCPTYPNTQAGCRMVTDPRDSCCQIPVCENPNTNEPTKVITGVPGVIEGNSLPPESPNPLQPRNSVCVYQGTQYQQGQTWDDGCSYTCECVDALTGNYRCVERCPRVPEVPTTCTMVPDPTDMCCQLVSCPTIAPNPNNPSTVAPNPNNPNNPNTIAPNPNNPNTIAPNPNNPYTQQPPLGTTVAPNPNSPAVPQAGFCLYKNQYYRETQVWYDDCNAICTCEDGNTGFYRCQKRCAAYNNVDTSCIMVPDPKDPQCCTMPECPLIPPGGTTPSGPTIIRPTQPPAVITNYPTPSPNQLVTPTPARGPDGQTLVPPSQTTQAPAYRSGCVYNGRVYQENEQWDDGCDYQCACLDDMTGQYRCNERCTRVPNLPQGCVLIDDPQDQCCQVPYCDFGPNPFPNGYPTPNPNPTQVPGLNPTTPLMIIPGYVTSSTGQNTTPSPYLIPSIGGSNVCVYQGVMYRQGEQWDEGCSKRCICDVNGLYTCNERCTTYPNLDPACTLRPNPNDPCCLVPDCNPNYVPGTNTGVTGSNPYVTPGSGPNYITPGELPGVTGTRNPLEPGSGTGVTGTRAPILVPTAAPGVFTGERPPIDYNIPSMTGYSSMCIYKGSAYSQGQNWDDGCQYKCECTDAQRGVYRCSERCSSMYFMPPGCTTVPDPNDSCCQRAMCSPSDFPVPSTVGTISPPLPNTTAVPNLDTTQPPTVVITMGTGPTYSGTRSPIGSTVVTFTGKPPNMCVYTDGRTFRQGETWTDGCAYNCRCVDATTNNYTCDFRCPAYGDLPTFCQLVDDPADPCCQKVECTPVGGKPLVPVISDNTPTASPTMVPGLTNVVPIGTYTVVSGSGLPPGETQPGFFGGRQVCVYHSDIHEAGDRWDDGCDFACECLDLEPAVYSCTSKCPTYPPLPQYCTMVNVPGQCCLSMQCDIPDAGTPYNPIPELFPNLVPTRAPPNQPQLNPQLIYPSGTGPVVGGGSNLPGNGYIIQPSTIGSVTDRCVFMDTDGSYRVYMQGETWRIQGCGYDCTCQDSNSGYYTCEPVCPSYTQGNMPPSCELNYVNGQCCPAVRCTNPDGTVVDPIQNPELTQVPVYGVLDTGFGGFRPGYVPSHTNTINGQNNVCVYKGTAHRQGERWDDGCDFTCDCTDASTGMYTCRKKCDQYTALPSICRIVNTGNDCCGSVQCTEPATTAPPVTTQPPVTGPGGLPQCTGPDTLANCNQYDKATACVGQFEPWARDNCPSYCGYCEDSSPTTPGPCVDKIDNCAAYGTSACQGQYEPWARDNCALTCNLCPCYDKLNNCNQYGAYACGGQYEAWARDNCASYCGLCPGGSPPSYVTGSPPPVTGSGVVPDGWTLLLKGVAGAPGDLWSLWQSPNTANENVPAAQMLTSDFMGHYKPGLTNILDQCDFQSIKVSVYNYGVEKAYVTFDGTNTDRYNWFDSARIVDSSFGDISSARSFLQMAGDPASGHEFYMGQPTSGCTGSGWMFVSIRNTCSYESGSIPGFYYSSSGSAANYASGDLESGDVFAIMGQGGSCSLDFTTPRSFTNRTYGCVYNQQFYQENQFWADTCRYNCTCENATTGFYRCYDMCPTYRDLPDRCTMVRQPGDCCAKPTGPGCDASGGCVYKNQYYAQDQQWDDGCDYTCECTDATSGRYQCTSMCLNFQLPPSCSYDPAPAGKCCPVPRCSDPNIVIQYPAGYVPR